VEKENEEFHIPSDSANYISSFANFLPLENTKVSDRYALANLVENI
jgi:hypothetical protein